MLSYLIIIAFGFFILYLIIANAVHAGVKWALSDMKEDIMKEMKSCQDIRRVDNNAENISQENEKD